MRFKSREYPGYDKDPMHGMSHEAKLIRDAWAFRLLSEDEKCEGWRSDQFEQLWSQVDAIWEKADFRIANLPPEVQDKYMKLQMEALRKAKAAGWDPDGMLELDD
ncbi:hypothetical protein SAMN05443662_0221 [Sulfurivirga caldicuralii]|uniref:Uncharacterized protein n=1 Tax=Sulfurivirga caldicuralii TaxID=364032 RepID=A0A1N6DKG3_9GAMM|nr:hypothetical protein [Sulfurivirga caldicuralii]SIN71272.1 hypothetical protein SAMN05443662_0221 [Sulfurivirga caldicuralii]